MRVTTDMNVRLLSSALQQHQNTLFRVRREMSSGRKVNLASDDPGAYEAIRNLRSDLSQLRQFERNTDMAIHYLSSADQGIYTAANILHRVNELAVKASDGVLDSSSRAAMAEEAGQLLTSLLAVANSSEGGRYTFAGLRADTAPFVAVEDPESGLITAVAYTGSEESRLIKNGPESYAVTGIPGRSETGEGGIFQTATRDLFDSIIRLRDQLTGSEGDPADIQNRIQDDLGHVLGQASLNGARQEHVTAHRTYLRAMQTTGLQSLDALESVDMAEASMRLAQAEQAYQAALYSTANIMRQATLLNYI